MTREGLTNCINQARHSYRIAHRWHCYEYCDLTCNGVGIWECIHGMITHDYDSHICIDHLDMEPYTEPAAYVEKKMQELSLTLTMRIAEIEKVMKETKEAHEKEVEALKAENENLKQKIEDSKSLVTTSQADAKSAKEEAKSAKEESQKAIEKANEQYSQSLSEITAKIQGLEKSVEESKELILNQQYAQTHAPQAQDVIHAPMADRSECQSELQECAERLNDCQDSYGDHGHSVMPLGRVVNQQHH